MLMYDRASSAGSRSLGVEHSRSTDRQRRINGHAWAVTRPSARLNSPSHIGRTSVTSV
jgi:hypothetical protein